MSIAHWTPGLKLLESRVPDPQLFALTFGTDPPKSQGEGKKRVRNFCALFQATCVPLAPPKDALMALAEAAAPPVLHVAPQRLLILPEVVFAWSLLPDPPLWITAALLQFHVGLRPGQLFLFAVRDLVAIPSQAGSTLAIGAFKHSKLGNLVPLSVQGASFCRSLLQSFLRMGYTPDSDSLPFQSLQSSYSSSFKNAVRLAYSHMHTAMPPPTGPHALKRLRATALNCCGLPMTIISLVLQHVGVGSMANYVRALPAASRSFAASRPAFFGLAGC